MEILRSLWLTVVVLTVINANPLPKPDPAPGKYSKGYVEDIIDDVINDVMRKYDEESEDREGDQTITEGEMQDIENELGKTVLDKSSDDYFEPAEEHNEKESSYLKLKADSTQDSKELTVEELDRLKEGVAETVVGNSNASAAQNAEVVPDHADTEDGIAQDHKKIDEIKEELSHSNEIQDNIIENISNDPNEALENQEMPIARQDVEEIVEANQDTEFHADEFEKLNKESTKALEESKDEKENNVVKITKDIMLDMNMEDVIKDKRALSEKITEAIQSALAERFDSKINEEEEDDDDEDDEDDDENDDDERKMMKRVIKQAILAVKEHRMAR